MDEVTSACGPLHVVRSDESRAIWNYLERKGNKTEIQ